MNFDKSQTEAIERAVSGESIIITGGAGTGKTTIIGEIARRLNGNVSIMSPTGKASARLKEATGYYACTVHRALGWNGETFMNAEKLNRTVIVDESSMLDSWLLSKLVEKKPYQLILVGDSGQLPPVGRGQPFHDLVTLKPDITCTLTTCWRNKSAVHKASNMIRAGKQPEKSEASGGETWRTIQTGSPKNTENTIINWIKAGQFDPTQDIILSARYGSDETDQGNIISLNKKILDIINPHENGEDWGVGDRVICNKNFSKLDLWNGDIGTIIDIDIDGNLWLELDRAREDSQQVLCKAEQKRQLKHAYCLSVHKSQGSQFRRVFVISLNKNARMLDRPLLYTAVTRAKKGCVVCGQLESFYQGIQKTKQRTTLLQTLITKQKEVIPC